MSEVVVIGAGVVGCAVALELARRGTRATVVDKNGAAGHGSTAASCGIVRRFYSTETMVAMAQESAEIWAHWGAWLEREDDPGLARFERPGMLFIPQRFDERIDAVLACMRSFGIPVERLSAAEVAQRFPFLDVASHTPIRAPHDADFFDATGRAIVGAVFEADAGQVVSPLDATTNLRDAAEAAGARFVMGRGVEAIERGGGPRRFRLRLADGTHLDADVVVNVAGPHSAKINALAGVELPLETRALRREVCAVKNSVLPPEEAALPIVGDLDSGVYVRPEAGGRDLAVGSLDPACDAFEWVDPDDFDDAVSAAGFERQVLRAMKRVPELELGRLRGLAGLYDVTPLDWNPVLDRTDVPGYYVAIGTSGSSFKTAPVIGALMAELIDACEGGRDHDRDPVRLHLPRTGFELDASFFSRLRSAHVTSGTVLG